MAKYWQCVRCGGFTPQHLSLCIRAGCKGKRSDRNVPATNGTEAKPRGKWAVGGGGEGAPWHKGPKGGGKGRGGKGLGPN
eukprot:4052060-Pyramimonas_sp.AAC.1